jgi:pimeloyl-ACP methyl ester carboxylesterase
MDAEAIGVGAPEIDKKSSGQRSCASRCNALAQWAVFSLLAALFLLTLPVWLFFHWIFTMPAHYLSMLLLAVAATAYLLSVPWARVEIEANPASYAIRASSIDLVATTAFTMLSVAMLNSVQGAARVLSLMGLVGTVALAIAKVFLSAGMALPILVLWVMPICCLILVVRVWNLWLPTDQRELDRAEMAMLRSALPEDEFAIVAMRVKPFRQKVIIIEYCPTRGKRRPLVRADSIAQIPTLHPATMREQSSSFDGDMTASPRHHHLSAELAGIPPLVPASLVDAEVMETTSLSRDGSVRVPAWEVRLGDFSTKRVTIGDEVVMSAMKKTGWSDTDASMNGAPVQDDAPPFTHMAAAAIETAADTAAPFNSLTSEDSQLAEASIPLWLRDVTLVMTHAFGAGSALWAWSLPNLAKNYRRIVLIDWRECGASERMGAKPDTSNVRQTERFFTDALRRTLLVVDSSLGGPGDGTQWETRHHIIPSRFPQTEIAKRLRSSSLDGKDELKQPLLAAAKDMPEPGEVEAKADDSGAPFDDAIEPSVAEFNQRTQRNWPYPGLGRFVLLGHSMGGYMSSVYTLRLGDPDARAHRVREIARCNLSPDSGPVGNDGTAKVPVTCMGVPCPEGEDKGKETPLPAKLPVSEPVVTPGGGVSTVGAVASKTLSRGPSDNRVSFHSSAEDKEARVPTMDRHDTLASMRAEFETDSFEDEETGGTRVADSAPPAPELVFSDSEPCLTPEQLFLVSPLGMPLEMPGVNHRSAPTRSIVWTVLSWMWNGGFTPQAATRLLGPFAPMVVRGMGAGRVKKWSRKPAWTETGLEKKANVDDMSVYIFNVTCQPAADEVALSVITQAGAWPTDSVGRRLSHNLSASIPLSFVYGATHDWMGSLYGTRVCERLTNRWTKEERGGPLGGKVSVSHALALMQFFLEAVEQHAKNGTLPEGTDEDRRRRLSREESNPGEEYRSDVDDDDEDDDDMHNDHLRSILGGYHDSPSSPPSMPRNIEAAAAEARKALRFNPSRSSNDVVDQSGHLLQLENPEQFARKVLLGTAAASRTSFTRLAALWWIACMTDGFGSLGAEVAWRRLCLRRGAVRWRCLLCLRWLAYQLTAKEADDPKETSHE